MTGFMRNVGMGAHGTLYTASKGNFDIERYPGYV